MESSQLPPRAHRRARVIPRRLLVSTVIAALALNACGSPGSTVASPPATGAGTSPAQPSSESSSAASSAPRAGQSSRAVGVAVARCGTESAFLQRLTLRQKLAQLLTVGVTGTADATQAVGQYGVGGIFIGSWTDMSILTRSAMAQVRAGAAVPPLVSIDEEGGRVSRAPGVNLLSARTIAATMTTTQTRAEGRRVGGILKSLGITVDFAPDADVSSQASDEVIGDRSYSSDPETVAKYSTAFASGLRDAGIYPVFKHFPGHGRSSGDSHLSGVTVPALSELQTYDLVPFRAAVTQRAGVMVGHVTVPGLTGGLPASVSPAAMRLLRTGSGYGAAPFAGPIFTDDLSGMAAITARYSITEAVSQSLRAGADVALWSSTAAVPEVLNTLVAAVTAGRLPAASVDAKVLRVARAKGAVKC